MDLKKSTKDVILFGIICVLCATTVMIIYYVNRNTQIVENKTETSLIETEHKCQYSEDQGDGFCDDEANTESCHFDFGDCCNQDSDKSLCTNCICKAPENDYKSIGNCSEEQHDRWSLIGQVSVYCFSI